MSCRISSLPSGKHYEGQYSKYDTAKKQGLGVWLFVPRSETGEGRYMVSRQISFFAV